MKISESGLAFIAGHEGFVSSAYRDPVGVLTIGYGFTMRSSVFAAWWRARYNRDLRMGDRITKDGAAQVLRASWPPRRVPSAGEHAWSSAPRTWRPHEAWTIAEVCGASRAQNGAHEMCAGRTHE